MADGRRPKWLQDVNQSGGHGTIFHFHPHPLGGHSQVVAKRSFNLLPPWMGGGGGEGEGAGGRGRGRGGGERDRQTDRERKREREDSNSKTLFYKNWRERERELENFILQGL